HPAAAAFPMLSDAELKELADDIKALGQRELITVMYAPDDTYGRDPIVLDGRNRLAACKLAGVEPKTYEVDHVVGGRLLRGNEHVDPIAFVISANLRRRHLDESQRAMVAAKLATLRDGQRQVGQLAHVPTQREASALLHVGERSVKRARAVLDSGD